jgi:hypothetical protein
VQILAAFVPVHGFLSEACGFLSGCHEPGWVGAATVVRIPLVESLSWLVVRRSLLLGICCRACLPYRLSSNECPHLRGCDAGCAFLGSEGT